MFQLTYISSAVRSMGEPDVAEILRASRRNNAAKRITGLLIYDGRRFLQALEGDEAVVEATYAAIRLDPRHRAIVTLSQRHVAGREFGDWAMAAQAVPSLAGPGSSVVETVDALVAQVPDANTRELFRSFARIERRAA